MAAAMLAAGRSRAEVWDALVERGVDATAAAALLTDLARLRDDAAAVQQAQAQLSQVVPGAPTDDDVEEYRRSITQRRTRVIVIAVAVVVAGACAYGAYGVYMLAGLCAALWQALFGARP